MNIAVAQSGGPTCAINASLVGVFKQAVKTPQIDAVFGSLNGIEGIINDQLIDLKLVIKTNEDMELLRQTPSTVLGSCRYKLPDVEEGGETYERILKSCSFWSIHRLRRWVPAAKNCPCPARITRFMKNCWPFSGNMTSAISFISAETILWIPWQSFLIILRQEIQR